MHPNEALLPITIVLEVLSTQTQKDLFLWEDRNALNLVQTLTAGANSLLLPPLPFLLVRKQPHTPPQCKMGFSSTANSKLWERLRCQGRTMGIEREGLKQTALKYGFLSKDSVNWVFWLQPVHLVLWRKMSTTLVNEGPSISSLIFTNQEDHSSRHHVESFLRNPENIETLSLLDIYHTRYKQVGQYLRRQEKLLTTLIVNKRKNPE